MATHNIKVKYVQHSDCSEYKGENVDSSSAGRVRKHQIMKGLVNQHRFGPYTRRNWKSTF